MKRQSIFMLIVLLFAAGFAATLSQEVNTYTDHSYKSALAENIPAGDYTIVEEWGNYVACTAYGYKGFVWVPMVKVTPSNVTVSGSGATLVKKPLRGDAANIVTNIWPGDPIILGATNVEWYKVQVRDKFVWVPSVRFKK